jgi:hypothetical protein
MSCQPFLIPHVDGNVDGILTQLELPENVTLKVPPNEAHALAKQGR